MRRAAIVAVLSLLCAAGCGGGGDGGGSGTTPRSTGQAADGPATHAAAAAPAPASRRITAAMRRQPVPILMYHVINSPPAGTPFPGLWVAPAALRAQLRALAGAGYRGVTLDTVLAAWRGRAALPKHPVVVSFDDGYRSQATSARRILRSFGWPGVLNLAWHNLDTPGMVTGAEVRALIRDGWEIDPHSITHADLTTLPAAQLRREIAGSRALIRERFGVPADAFCYPAGKFDGAVAAATRAAGYRAATTVEPGVARPTGDPFTLPRIRVQAGDGATTVLDRVQAAIGSAA